MLIQILLFYSIYFLVRKILEIIIAQRILKKYQKNYKRIIKEWKYQAKMNKIKKENQFKNKSKKIYN